MPDARTPDVPLLYGGISKQPAHLRFPNQVADADNVRFSIKDGIHKRAGSTYVAKVTGLTGSANYRLHPIVRDDSEKYLAIYGDSILKIFETDGTACTVTITSEGQAYIDSGSADADDMQLVTIADHTELVNRTMAMVIGNESTNYVVTATHQDYDVLSSYCPAASTYHQALAATATVPAGYFQFANISGFGRWEKANPQYWRVPWARWNETDFNPCGFRVRFKMQDQAFDGLAYDHTGNGEGEKHLSGTGAFAGYTHTGGDEIYINGDGGDSLPVGWYAIASKVDDDAILLTGDYRDANDDAQTIPGTDETDCDCDYISQAFAVSENFNTTTADDMYAVALRLQTSLRGAGATDACLNYTSTGTNLGKFEIITEEYGTGAAIVGLTAPDSGYDLTLNNTRPFHFSSGTTTAGSGTARQTLEIDGRWTPVAAPGSTAAVPDPDTLPIDIVRSSLGPPVVFDVDIQSWDSRTSGSSSTNPAPTPMTDGLALADMIFKDNRRWFFAGEWAFTSQAGDYNNVFIEDATSIADSDPIVIRLSSDQVTLIDFVLPYRDAVLVFTKAARQFQIEGGADGFSQDTVRVKPVSKHRTLSVHPEEMEGRVYMATADSTDTQIIELTYDDLQAATRGLDVSQHVEGLLPTTLKSIRVHNDTQTVFLLPIDGYTIYVYQQHRAEGEESQRRQSAWTKYTFDSSYRICDIAIIDDFVYMLVEDATQYIIEKFPVEAAADSGTCGASTTTSTTGSGEITPPTTASSTPPGFQITSPTTGGTLTSGTAITIETPPIIRCLCYGTMVEMNDGSMKRIEDLHVGDGVATRSSVARVSSIHHQVHPYYFLINSRIRATYDHLFALADAFGFVEAHQLKAGDLLVRRHGSEAIASIERIDGPCFSVAITLEDSDCHWADGVLVGTDPL